MSPDRLKIFVPILIPVQLKKPPPDLCRSSEGASLLMPQISWKYLRPDDLFSFRRRTRLPSTDAYYQLKMFSFPGIHSSEKIYVPIPNKSDFQSREPPPNLV